MMKPFSPTPVSPWMSLGKSAQDNPFGQALKQEDHKIFGPQALEPKTSRLFRMERERRPGQLVTSAGISLGSNKARPEF